MLRMYSLYGIVIESFKEHPIYKDQKYRETFNKLASTLKGEFKKMVVWENEISRSKDINYKKEYITVNRHVINTIKQSILGDFIGDRQ